MQPDLNKLETLSAAELGRAVNGGKVSPSEIVDYFTDRIERRNKSINAFVYTKFEYAKSAAKELEKKLTKKKFTGVFAGVPFALKDFLPSKVGWTNSHGGVRALIKEDTVNSEFCRAMETAGGIAIGKTNAPAFGFRGTCDNLLYGATSTPFLLGYNSGGSSGGSAAAVDDGLVPIAEGSDGGGSIRIPAAWCNLFGFKASVGTIPSVCRPDAWAATHPYCFNGGLTKTVEDSAILLNYMSCYNPKDPLSLDFGKRDFTELMKNTIKGLKIGFTADFGIFPAEREVAEIVENSALRFEEVGAVVEPLHFNLKRSAYEYAEMWCKSICIDTAIELEEQRKNGFDLVRDYKNDIPEEFIYWNEKAAKSSIMDYYMFNLIRTELYEAQRETFENYDIIISPTTICRPVRNDKNGNTLGPSFVNGQKVEPIIGFCETFLANFTGNPAASIPAGLSKKGLPVGMQIIGKRFKDEDVLAVSYSFEKIQPWRDLYNIPFSRKII